MSIFKRSKKSDPAGRAGEVDGVETLEGQDPVDTDADGTQADGDAAGDDAVTRTASVVLDRSEGPFDASEVDGRGGRIDLGALWMQGVPGMELRLEVDQNTQQVNAAMAVIGDSALQVQAFAAPRSGGLWDEIRAELVTAIEAQGGTAEERVGPLGTELRTRMPSRGENGRTVFAPATFLGVDELLPLALPREAERAAEAAEAEADAEDEAERTSLDPFTRGPEITEVR